MRLGKSTLKTAAATATLAAAGITALAVASPASASTFDKHLGVGCPQPYSQSCPPRQGMSAYTNGPLAVTFIADGNACAPGNARVFIDGRQLDSAVVQPGQSVSFYDDATPGSHLIEVQMDGILGGCNTGAMSGWSGTLRIDTDSDALAHLSSPSAPDANKPPLTHRPSPSARAPASYCDPIIDICVH